MAIHHYIVILTPLLLPHIEIPRYSVGDVMAKTSINGHLFLILISLLPKRLITYSKVDHLSN